MPIMGAFAIAYLTASCLSHTCPTHEQVPHTAAKHANTVRARERGVAGRRLVRSRGWPSPCSLVLPVRPAAADGSRAALVAHAAPLPPHGQGSRPPAAPWARRDRAPVCEARSGAVEPVARTLPGIGRAHRARSPKPPATATATHTHLLLDGRDDGLVDDGGQGLRVLGRLLQHHSGSSSPGQQKAPGVTAPSPRNHPFVAGAGFCGLACQGHAQGHCDALTSSSGRLAGACSHRPGAGRQRNRAARGGPPPHRDDGRGGVVC